MRKCAKAARHFAARIADRAASGSASWDSDVRRAYSVALARLPSDAELADATQFLNEQSKLYAADAQAE